MVRLGELAAVTSSRESNRRHGDERSSGDGPPRGPCGRTGNGGHDAPPLGFRDAEAHRAYRIAAQELEDEPHHRVADCEDARGAPGFGGGEQGASDEQRRAYGLEQLHGQERAVGASGP